MVVMAHVADEGDHGAVYKCMCLGRECVVKAIAIEGASENEPRFVTSCSF